MLPKKKRLINRIKFYLPKRLKQLNEFLQFDKEIYLKLKTFLEIIFEEFIKEDIAGKLKLREYQEYLALMFYTGIPQFPYVTDHRKKMITEERVALICEISERSIVRYHMKFRELINWNEVEKKFNHKDWMEIINEEKCQ